MADNRQGIDASLETDKAATGDPRGSNPRGGYVGLHALVAAGFGERPHMAPHCVQLALRCEVGFGRPSAHKRKK
eukprot:7662598-Alexandrium_andersonii.AAC.1